jgi:hypothetical protein
MMETFAQDGIGDRSNTIHNPSFGITPLSASKIKKPPRKINNFTYTELDQIDRNP